MQDTRLYDYTLTIEQVVEILKSDIKCGVYLIVNGEYYDIVRDTDKR